MTPQDSARGAAAVATVSVVLGLGLAAAVALLVADQRSDHDDPTSLDVLNARSAASVLDSALALPAPAFEPPHLTTFQFVVANGDGTELRFQEADLQVVVCGRAPSTQTACQSPAATIVRTEADGARVTDVAVIEQDALKETDETLDAGQREAVLAFWKDVPLPSGAVPAWIVDLADQVQR